jgi:hypothetical protein
MGRRRSWRGMRGGFISLVERESFFAAARMVVFVAIFSSAPSLRCFMGENNLDE